MSKYAYKRRGKATCKKCGETKSVPSCWGRKGIKILRGGKPAHNTYCDSCHRTGQRQKSEKLKEKAAARLVRPSEMLCKECGETKNIDSSWARKINKNRIKVNGAPYSDVRCDECELDRNKLHAKERLALSVMSYIVTVSQQFGSSRWAMDDNGNRLVYLTTLKEHPKHGSKYNVKKAGWLYHWFPCTVFYSFTDIQESYVACLKECKKLGVVIPPCFPAAEDAFDVFSKVAADFNSGRLKLLKKLRSHKFEEVVEMLTSPEKMTAIAEEELKRRARIEEEKAGKRLEYVLMTIGQYSPSEAKAIMEKAINESMTMVEAMEYAEAILELHVPQFI